VRNTHQQKETRRYGQWPNYLDKYVRTATNSL